MELSIFICKVLSDSERFLKLQPSKCLRFTKRMRFEIRSALLRLSQQKTLNEVYYDLYERDLFSFIRFFLFLESKPFE